MCREKGEENSEYQMRYFLAKLKKKQAYRSHVGILIPEQRTNFGITANTEIAIFRRVSKSHPVTFLVGLLTSFVFNVK